jgi:hypothetical protein
MTRIASVMLTLVLAVAGPSLAHADVPFFNATCPGGLEVHADEGGPVFINGQETSLHRFNENYYEAEWAGTTLSISMNPDETVAVSYTGRGRVHGICEVNAQQRHGRKVQAEPEGRALEISMADMPRFCAGEASAAFDVRPPEITTNAAFRIGKRHVVQGYFEAGQGTTFFNCYFDERGSFVEVR